MNMVQKNKISKDIQAVVFDIKNEELQFLLLKRLNKNTGEFEHRLVKGGLKKGEKLKTSLKREILEETGIEKVEIIKTLKSYSYAYMYGEFHVTHNVNTFLVRALSTDNYNVVNQEEEGGFDIGGLVWVSYKKAFSLLNYNQERDLLLEAFKGID